MTYQALSISMGRVRGEVNLVKALQLAAVLED